jgi:ribosomal protein L34E
MLCASCNLPKEDYARIKVEIVDKKSKEIIEVTYGEIICIDCLKKRYHERIKIRVYV